MSKTDPRVLDHEEEEVDGTLPPEDHGKLNGSCRRSVLGSVWNFLFEVRFKTAGPLAHGVLDHEVSFLLYHPFLPPAQG